MRVVLGLWLSLASLVSGAARLVVPVVEWFEDHPICQSSQPMQVAERAHRPEVIDVNRPRTPFDCELPIGEQWYGSRAACLAELCAGHNVYNEFLFDADNRRRRNPCYGQNPTEFPQ